MNVSVLSGLTTIRDRAEAAPAAAEDVLDATTVLHRGSRPGDDAFHEAWSPAGKENENDEQEKISASTRPALRAKKRRSTRHEHESCER